VFDGRHPWVRRDLADPHEMHRTVMSAFPDVPDGSARVVHGVLFRIERGGLEPVVLVQSRSVPDWERLADRGLRSAQQREIELGGLQLEEGRRLRFRLEANPTRKVSRVRDDGSIAPQGRRVELTSDAARIDWLVRRGQLGGFVLAPVVEDAAVPDVQVSVLPKRMSRRRSDAITVRAVRFDGHLVVTSRDALLETIRHGIGPAKAYGCGLLSVGAPLA